MGYFYLMQVLEVFPIADGNEICYENCRRQRVLERARLTYLVWNASSAANREVNSMFDDESKISGNLTPLWKRWRP